MMKLIALGLALAPSAHAFSDASGLTIENQFTEVSGLNKESTYELYADRRSHVVDGFSMASQAALIDAWCNTDLSRWDRRGVSGLLAEVYGVDVGFEHCGRGAVYPDADIAFLHGDPRQPVILGFGGQELGDALYDARESDWLMAEASPTMAEGQRAAYPVGSGWDRWLTLEIWIDIDRTTHSIAYTGNAGAAERLQLAAAVAECQGYTRLGYVLTEVRISSYGYVQSARESAAFVDEVCAQLP